MGNDNSKDVLEEHSPGGMRDQLSTYTQRQRGHDHDPSIVYPAIFRLDQEPYTSNPFLTRNAHTGQQGSGSGGGGEGDIYGALSPSALRAGEKIASGLGLSAEEAEEQRRTYLQLQRQGSQSHLSSQPQSTSAPTDSGGNQPGGGGREGGEVTEPQVVVRADSFKGLYNNTGLYHCFLNVCIQMLYVLRPYRQQFMEMGAIHTCRSIGTSDLISSTSSSTHSSPCLFCALQGVFAQYMFVEDANSSLSSVTYQSIKSPPVGSRIPSMVINGEQVRKALSEAYAKGHKYVKDMVLSISASNVTVYHRPWSMLLHLLYLRHYIYHPIAYSNVFSLTVLLLLNTCLFFFLDFNSMKWLMLRRPL